MILVSLNPINLIFIVNEHYRTKLYGNDDLINPYKKEKDTDHVNLKKNYTRFWIEVTKTFNELIPIIKQKLLEGDNKDLLLLLYGLTSGQITDRSLLSEIQEIILDQLRAHKETDLHDNELILGLQGLAQLPFKNDKTDIIINYLKPFINKIDVTELDLSKKLKLAWSLSSLEKFEIDKLAELVNDLNVMPFEKARNELHYEEFLMLKDIYYCVTYLNKTKNDLNITNNRYTAFIKRAQEILKEYPESKANLDPFKSHVVNGLGKYNFSNVTKNISFIAMSLSELGADTIGNANSIKFQASAHATIHKNTYPYKPDLLFRYQTKSIVSLVLYECTFIGFMGSQQR